MKELPAEEADADNDLSEHQVTDATTPETNHPLMHEVPMKKSLSSIKLALVQMKLRRSCSHQVAKVPYSMDSRRNDYRHNSHYKEKEAKL